MLGIFRCASMDPLTKQLGGDYSWSTGAPGPTLLVTYPPEEIRPALFLVEGLS